MARTHISLDYEDSLEDRLQSHDRWTRIFRLGRAAALTVSSGAVLDVMTNGSVTGEINDALNTHVGTGNFNATRLAVAGLTAVFGVIGAINEHRRRITALTIESMSDQESQLDRIATVLELDAQLRSYKNAVRNTYDQFPD